MVDTITVEAERYRISSGKFSILLEMRRDGFLKIIPGDQPAVDKFCFTMSTPETVRGIAMLLLKAAEIGENERTTLFNKAKE